MRIAAIKTHVNSAYGLNMITANRIINLIEDRFRYKEQKDNLLKKLERREKLKRINGT